MPEDMKEMYKQRQRELQLERAQDDGGRRRETKTDENAAPSAITEPRLEDKTVPSTKTDALPEPRINTETPKETKPAGPRRDPRLRLARAKRNQRRRKVKRATTARRDRSTTNFKLSSSFRRGSITE